MRAILRDIIQALNARHHPCQCSGHRRLAERGINQSSPYSVIRELHIEGLLDILDGTCSINKEMRWRNRANRELLVPQEGQRTLNLLLIRAKAIPELRRGKKVVVLRRIQIILRGKQGLQFAGMEQAQPDRKLDRLVLRGAMKSCMRGTKLLHMIW